ncbi:MAG: alkaline phosphatase family protein [bacterium]
MSARAKRVAVIGLDCAAPELVFRRFAEALPNLGRLRRSGVWGELRSVVPAITIPAWACSMSGLDPGQLGIYGYRSREGHGYEQRLVDATALRRVCVWDLLSAAGEPVIVLGVPPSYPPRPLNGVQVGCLLTPHTGVSYTYPPTLKGEIAEVLGEYVVDVEEFRTDRKERLLEEIAEMTRRRFTLFRHLLRSRAWTFAMMVEIGVDRMHHAFWAELDESHPRHVPGNPHAGALLAYYRLVDAELGRVLDELEDDDALLVLSDHGARPMLGGVRINEWLRREGYLVLRREVKQTTPVTADLVDWSRTRAWGAGGYCGRVFLNVRGREPEGVVDAEQLAALRDELSAGLAGIRDPQGRPLDTRVFVPQELYRECRGVPPDLIVYFGGLDYRAVGSVGPGGLFADNDLGPDGANHDEQGIFLLRAPGVPSDRELEGLRLIDCGPTLLELLGQPVPEGLVGRPMSFSESPRDR